MGELVTWAVSDRPYPRSPAWLPTWSPATDLPETDDGLTQALGRESIATAEGIAATAAILDDLLARRIVPGRPQELSDDLDWMLAASGRAESSDNRLPLIG